MKGLIKLSHPIRCKREVLGLVFQTTVAGNNICIYFPKFPSFDDELHLVGICNPLLPPDIAKTWSFGDESILWGYPQSYPEMDCCIEVLAVSVNCCGSEMGETASTLRSAIRVWEKSFSDYLRISTGQETERNEEYKNKKKCDVFFLEPNYGQCFLADTIYMSIPNLNSFATKSQISDSICFASSGKELLLEYQMLLSAYDARRNGLNRQAIIDACSAVELCLVSYISNKVKRLNMNPKSFLDKYKSLGDRFDLINQLDTTFPPDDYQAKIVKPRNNLVHNRDIYPTNEITDQLITCIEKCLKHCFERYY